MTYQPGRANFRFYRGASFSTEQVDITDAAGVPVDLSVGWTGRMRIWREDADPATATPLFDSDVPSTLVLALANGSFRGDIPFDQTLIDVGIDGETWYYRVELTNTAATPDEVDRTLEGYVVAFP